MIAAGDGHIVEVVPASQGADHAAWATAQVIAENDRTFGPDDWERFGLRVTDRDGLVIGGVAGHSHWASGYIGHLWVHPDHRRRGLGTDLLVGAMRLLYDRACRVVLLDTYSFQGALPFYRRHGFEVVLTVENHPPAHRRWTLSRPLP